MSRSRAIAFAVVAAVVGGCQLIVGITDDGGLVRDGGSGDVIAPPAPPDPCVKVHPIPGTVVDAGALDLPRIFVTSKFIIRPIGAPPIGYDLDSHCSGIATSTTTLGPCNAPGSTVPAVDDPGGVDNAFGGLIDQAALFFLQPGAPPPPPGSDLAGEAITAAIASGEFADLIFVYNYNGEPDDDSVVVGFVPSAGLLETSTCGSDGAAGPDALDGSTSAPNRLTPRWNGCDRWGYRSDRDLNQFLNGPSVPALAPAYVVGHVLVVRWERVSFSLGTGADMSLTDGVLTVKLQETDGGFELKEGVLAGRAETNPMLIAAAHLPIGQELICNRGELALQTLQKYGCAAQDLRATHSEDNAGGVCNAVSFAVGFEATPARMGGQIVRDDTNCPPLDLKCP